MSAGGHLSFVSSLCAVLCCFELLCCTPVTTTEDTLGKLKIDSTKIGALTVTLNGFNGPLHLNLGQNALNPLAYFEKGQDAEVAAESTSAHYNYYPRRGNTTSNSVAPAATIDSTVKTPGVFLQHRASGQAEIDCYTVHWPNPPSLQEDCIDLEDSSWYGGGELRFQRWPIDNSHPRFPYVTGDFFHHPYGGLIEKLWFNSRGYSVQVDEATPLFLRFNQSGDGRMCFSASYDEYPYNPDLLRESYADKELTYVICSAPDVRQIAEYSLNRSLKKPRGVIDEKILSQPIWSTWAKYKADINQQSVLDFAKEISDHGFGASHLEVDDKWETCYGDLEFDLTKFPDPAAMIRQVKSLGFGVSFWVHPFTNVNCKTYQNGADKGYFVKNATTGQPMATVWWEGVGGYLDMTNEEAKDSMAERLRNLQQLYGIDTYKFDAGELHWNNPGFTFTNQTILKTPNQFTRLYTELAARFGTGVEVRAAYQSQDLPIFLRMLDKDSKWDYDNGLKTLIPTSLLFSSTGYPFILPDMIGGNNYNDNSSITNSDSPTSVLHEVFAGGDATGSATARVAAAGGIAPPGPVSGTLPNRELFIRWLQLNAFLPALQFSITPWDYDQDMTDLSKKLVTLHQSYVPLFKRLSDEAVVTGHPIIRPLWWTDPLDPVALTIDSEFLVGNDLLVAPVLEQGAVARDVYLPSGNWKAKREGDTAIYAGPIWLTNYSAPLEQIPYFERQ